MNEAEEAKQAMELRLAKLQIEVLKVLAETSQIRVVLLEMELKREHKGLHGPPEVAGA